jgi:hypothetical protein
MSADPSHVWELAPRLFHAWFPEPSWNVWRAVIKAAFAEPLSAEELVTFREVAGGREPPRTPIRELWCQVGRRGGKDAVASAIVTAAALVDYRPNLRRGERATCMLLAVDRETADICRGYVSAHFEANAPLGAMVVRETRDGLELNNCCDIVIGTNTFRAVRGRTLACVVLDEVPFWRDENSASPDFEVYRALRPGLMTLPGSMLIGIGSPYRKSGLQYDKFKRCYGVDDPRVLYVKGPSELFNPTADPEEIASAYADDAASARAEYGAEWRDDLASFVDIEMIEACVDNGVLVRPPKPHIKYAAFTDSSSGTGQDSFSLGIAHAEGRGAVLDLAHEIRPPFSPDNAIAAIAALLKGYGVRSVTGDKYSAGFVIEGFSKQGIRYSYSDRDRSAIYIDTLPLFTAGRVSLIDNKRLVAQFASLERRTGAGRDRIDHPRDAHDDLANAVAGALTLAAPTGKIVLNISEEALRMAERATPFGTISHEPQWW